MPIILSSRSMPPPGSPASEPPPSGGKKCNPGKYVRADAQGYPSKDTQHYATYTKAKSTSEIIGAEIPVNWYRTNPSIGTFDFSYIEDHINDLTANRTNGKKVLLVTQFQNYGGTSVPSTPQLSDDATLPDFIIDAGYGAVRTSDGVMPKLDNSTCMNYLIAWLEAIAAEYDSDPYVELFTVGETSSAYSGMNASNYATQWLRIPAVLAAAWTETWCCIGHNGMTSPGTSITMAAEMAANQIGMAVEDAAGFYGSEPAQYGGWGYYAWAGVGVWDDSDGNGPVDYGTTDLRFTLPMRAESQVVRSDQTDLTELMAIMNDHWGNTHSVFTTYFDDSGVSYTPDYYGTSTPATDYSGSNVMTFLSNAANQVDRLTCST